MQGLWTPTDRLVMLTALSQEGKNEARMWWAPRSNKGTIPELAVSGASAWGSEESSQGPPKPEILPRSDAPGKNNLV